jgi:hypothetical protein
MPHAETAHEPVELPDRPRPFRVHFPDGRTQDVTLHPDGVMTTVLAGQVLRSLFTFDEMRERNWEHTQIEWDPPTPSPGARGRRPSGHRPGHHADARHPLNLPAPRQETTTVPHLTKVGGEIRIDPPLTWAEVKDSPFNPANPSWNDEALDVKLHIEEETVETDDGPLTRRTASALIPAWENAYKAYHLMEHLQAAMAAFPGHTFTGRLACEGCDDNYDLWRVVVRDGRAQRVEPRIVWPDEEDQADRAAQGGDDCV